MRLKSSRTLKLLMSLVTGISVLAMGVVPAAFAAPPNTVKLPEFSGEVLTPASQAAAAWKNTIPNALADYYTYQPLTTADAGLAGFPANLKCGVGTGPGTGSDCYIITVKQLLQPMSLDFLNLPGISAVSGANAFPGPGLIGADGLTPLVDQTSATGLITSAGLTKAWGYGSGGRGKRVGLTDPPVYAGWQPYGPTGPTLSRGNAPGAFQDTPIGLTTGEGAGVTGIWHFPAPTIKGTTGRPVYVQWLNDLPNVRPQGHDPSVDCGSKAANCYPYNRIVTHVHGAHVTPESDGLAVAWYTPNFALFGEGKFADNLYPGTAGKPIYQYPMTQEAGTIWYHDHAIGTTHLNTNNGMAGFFPVTDANEQALIKAGTLPKPAFDNGLALQDRHFNTAGQMVMPDYATYDRTTPGCIIDPVTNLADPQTCDRLQWAKVKDPASATDPTPAVKYVPVSLTVPASTPEGTAAITLGNSSYDLNFPAGCTPDLKNSFEGIDLAGKKFTQCAPFPASSATLEYFGNMPVVNGVTYGNFNLQARVQRLRFIGGTDSRTWIMQLVKAGATGTATDCGTPPIAGGCTVYDNTNGDIIPFWQIGSEQGLLDKPVKRDFIALMGGERVDVLVDFTGVAPNSKFILKNLGDDAPFSGNYDFATLATRQPTSVEIPEIMQFTVTAADFVATPNSALPSDLVLAAGTPLRPATPLVYPTPTAGEPVRTVSLIEITDQYGRTMPTIDARGYIPPGMMTTEYIKKNNTEYWDIVNTTVDAHPMHIHQVAFRALYRETINAFTPPYSSVTDSVFSQPSFVAGARTTVDEWDAGWKDTIQVIPGTSVRVIATWDLEGEYVWHCHILSHEEHDMMRPFMVVTASTTAAPASLTAAADNTQGTVTLVWSPVSGATGYVIHESIDNFANSNYAVTTGPVTKAVLKNVADGTYSYRIAAILGSAQTGFTTSGSSAVVAKTVAAPALVTAPAISNTGLIAVTWTASATPSFFASATGGLYYPVQYLVSYDVTATSATGTVYTTTGITATGATIGQTPDPVTGAVLPLPDGTYTISVVANLASWNPSPAKAAPNTTTVAVLAISPITAPAGTAKVFYSLPITATGGTGSYSFAITTTPLSAVLTINPATGVISGTPTVAGTTAVTVTVTDTANNIATASTNIVIGAPVALALPAVVAPAGHINSLYTLTFAATGGSTPYVYSSTVLPAGLTIDPATGVISGTPTVAGTFAVTVTVTDFVLKKATAKVSIVINPDTLVVTPVAVAQFGTVKVAYTLTLTTTGGLPPIKWAASGLPAGLTISNAGVISGTPKTAGAYPVTVTAIDALATTATTTFTITVNPPAPLAIPAIVAPAATLNVPYSLLVAATGGSTPYVYSTTTVLPVGLVIDPATGVISGIPTGVITKAKTYTVTVSVTDALLAVATRNFKITVNPTAVVAVPLVLTAPAVVPVGTVNAAYKLTFKTTGGTAPYTYSADILPTGLSISNVGVISGIIAPAAVPTGLSATIPVNITVVDSTGLATASVGISITVNQVIPKAPSKLTATAAAVPVGTPATAPRSVTLGWVDNSNNETGFALERSTTLAFTAGTVTIINSVLAANTITYNDTLLLAKTTYYYRVMATNDAGASAYSPVVTVKTK